MTDRKIVGGKKVIGGTTDSARLSRRTRKKRKAKALSQSAPIAVMVRTKSRV
jgi:hypothetical protein